MLSKIKSKTLSVIFLLVYIISLIPVIYIGFYNYASGDDYYYGAPVKLAIANNATVWEIIKVAWKDVIREYYAFQGTLATMFVWRFEPAIWGEKVYSVTVFIALIMLNLGIFYFFYVFMVKVMDIELSSYFAAATLSLFFLIQFITYPRSGLYFFPGVIRYTFAFGLVCLAMGLVILYLDKGYKRYLVGIILLMTYLGGSGFPAIVMSGLGLFYLMVWAWLSNDKDRKKRALFLIIPMVLELIGFGIAAVCPGNANRGGEDFGFSIGRVVHVFYKSFTDGTTGIFRYFIDARPLILLPVCVFVLAYVSKSSVKIKVKDILIVAVLGLFLVCMTRSPEYYAGESVDGGISGGVYDSYYYVSVVYVVIMSTLLGLFVGAKKKSEALSKNAVGALLIFMALFTVLLNKHLLPNMLDYIIYDYVKSGQAADYEAQMQERFELLSDPEELDVVVPMINDQQGPLMHMAVTDDPNAYTNEVTARFYGKRTITAIDRDKWNELYGK